VLDSIFIALSGLRGHQRGLDVISHNVANMNTPGFKGSTVGFADILGPDGGRSGAQDAAGGGGLDAPRTTLDLRAGDTQQTGRDLDLALEGDGSFVFRDAEGALRYGRGGAFEFDARGRLVGRGHGLQVLARAAGGALEPIALDGLRLSAPHATTELRLTGNLSSTATEHAIDPLVVYDRLGGAHTLRLAFTRAAAAGFERWTVQASEAGRALDQAVLEFAGGRPLAGAAPLKLRLDLGQAEPSEVALVLGPEVSAFSSGSSSTLALDTQDGHASGSIATLGFDAGGRLQVGYSNGRTASGARLVLAELHDDGGLQPLGEGLFGHAGGQAPRLREAGEDLRVKGGTLELSNVDLTREFGALILMQRGYQASSQVLGTANQMLQELFDLGGRR
jgi:flagellar hook protein FlgE